MQFNVQVVFITTALLAFTSLAMSAPITLFTGPNCTSATLGNFTEPLQECFIFEGNSTESASHSGVPNTIELFISGGGNEFCTNGPALLLNGPSGCATAPAG
ncbi:hypothetical protein CPB84DRAFT_1793261 [Gymnopilus junonius]|uniref:Uncharacterized protein n=1 Tax=Gymnopilus junonius TaxID=109634 RepID=A0A9P5NCK5_GYMJU|nr:hypothetical protein CPB84DRAFT_1793261 [Gymnopilus junonius]